MEKNTNNISDKILDDQIIPKVLDDTDAIASKDILLLPELIPFHPKAERFLKNYASNFAASLVRQSQNEAFQRKDDIVLVNHINKAIELLKRQERSKWKEFIIFVSSSLLGIFGQSFVAELFRLTETPPSGNLTSTMIYAIITLVSIVVATIALMR